MSEAALFILLVSLIGGTSFVILLLAILYFGLGWVLRKFDDRFRR